MPILNLTCNDILNTCQSKIPVYRFDGVSYRLIHMMTLYIDQLITQALVFWIDLNGYISRHNTTKKGKIHESRSAILHTFVYHLTPDRSITW
jgi:hypothetical protein